MALKPSKETVRSSTASTKSVLLMMVAPVGDQADWPLMPLGRWVSGRGLAVAARITSYNVCYTKLLRAQVLPAAPLRTVPPFVIHVIAATAGKTIKAIRPPGNALRLLFDHPAQA